MLQRLAIVLGIGIGYILGGDATSLAGQPLELVVFGDSLVDTGNLFVATTVDPASVPFPPHPPYFQGRFTNGPVWVEYFAERAGASGPPLPSLLGGSNYAWGGAETGAGFSARETPNIGEQIADYLQTPATPQENQLFVISGGSNDFDQPSGTPANPDQVVANMVQHIETLADAGARNFLIPNVAPLGDTPQLNDTDLRQLVNLLVAYYNFRLAVALERLEDELDINIIRLNVFGLTKTAIRFPGLFRLTNVTDSAKLNPFDFFDTAVVDNPDEYLFFDAVHPTTVAHESIGKAAALRWKFSSLVSP